jgi:putative spermidine/putrescine transport system ATP-binding protein
MSTDPAAPEVPVEPAALGNGAVADASVAPLLSVAGATKRFGDIEAVRELSFEVAKGEFFTLLGPSGCGKTTTLMALAGFEELDDGTIRLEGNDITHLSPERRNMGVVFQSYALFPHMTVLENVLFPLHMRGISSTEGEQRARAALRQVELDERYEQAKPAQLSGGQQQRVALARAVVFDPPVLLMDEPLAALDRQLRQTLQFELRHLQARLETTVIYVTHDQEEALVLSDRIAVMRGGSFEQVDSPREVYDQPANAFVAAFLGSSNRVPVELHPTEGDKVSVVPRDGQASGWTLPAGLAPEGDEAVLMVRPERVRLVDPDSSRPPDRLRLGATVRDAAFLGDHLRVECAVFDDLVWTLRLDPAEAPQRLPRSGSDCCLEWAATDTRLLAL